MLPLFRLTDNTCGACISKTKSEQRNEEEENIWHDDVFREPVCGPLAYSLALGSDAWHARTRIHDNYYMWRRRWWLLCSAIIIGSANEPMHVVTQWQRYQILTMIYLNKLCVFSFAFFFSFSFPFAFNQFRFSFGFIFGTPSLVATTKSERKVLRKCWHWTII